LRAVVNLVSRGVINIIIRARSIISIACSRILCGWF
jgi:hypothetical protein